MGREKFLIFIFYVQSFVYTELHSNCVLKQQSWLILIYLIENLHTLKSTGILYLFNKHSSLVAFVYIHKYCQCYVYSFRFSVEFFVLK